MDLFSEISIPVRRAGLRGEIHAGRPSRVAMVEPDHLPPPGDERVDQLIGPSDSLRRGAHNQQDRRITGTAGSLRPQTHLTGGDELFFGKVHGQELSELISPFQPVI